MASALDTAIDRVRRMLDGRRVVWFGIRGEDGEALLSLPEFESSYAVIAPVRSGRLRRDANVALEDLSGVRPDLDRYDLDLEPDEHTREFRRRLLREVSGRSVLVTYRPSALVSALAFSMDDTLTLAGMFKDRQAAFEHKPWVERSLGERGVEDLGWRYVADEHRSRVKRMLDAGPQILRASRTSGGVGIVRVDSEDDVDRFWPTQPDSFVAVAPFLASAIPVNVSGCVFDDGGIVRHPPSLQLIGIPDCTDRPFGYCGNDFGAVRRLSATALERLDALVATVGRWLHEERYRGMFGVDALIDGDRVLFTEVNARFQGSSALSAELAGDLGVPDLFLDHVAAMLGGASHRDGLRLPEWAAAQPSRSQVVVHNVGDTELRRDPSATPAPRAVDARFDQLPDERLVSRPGAAIGRFVVERSVTDDGMAIDAAGTDLVAALQAAYVPAESSVPSGTR